MRPIDAMPLCPPGKGLRFRAAPRRCRRQDPAPARPPARSSPATADRAGRHRHGASQKPRARKCGLSTRSREPASAAAGTPARINSAAASFACSGRAQAASAPSISGCRSRRSGRPSPASGTSAGTTAQSARQFPSSVTAMAIQSSAPGAAIDAVRCVMLRTIADGPRPLPELCLEKRIGHRPQHRFEHREIDPRHFGGPGPPPQCRGGDKGEHQAAHRIEPRHADARRDLRVAVEPGKPGIALQQRAVGDGARLRTGAAKARCRDVDQPRIDLAQCIGPEPEPVHHPGREILDQYVRSARQVGARRRSPRAFSGRARCRACPAPKPCAVRRHGPDRRGPAPRL